MLFPPSRRWPREDDLRPALVVSQPSRPVGRGRKIQAPPVAQCAERLGLPVVQPESAKDQDFLAHLRELAPDVAAVVAYGQIFRRSLLELPRLGCVNLHGSLLPKYRGAAPIQAAIAEGEAVTGVTTMLMERGLDSGPMLLKAELEIGRDEKTPELAPRLAALGAPLMVETLRRLDAGTVEAEPQDHERATFSPRLQRSDAVVDWELAARRIYDRWRGYYPWPGLSSTLAGAPVKLVDVRPADGSAELVDGTAQVGVFQGLVDDAMCVTCGNATMLLVERLQRPGKKPPRSLGLYQRRKTLPGRAVLDFVNKTVASHPAYEFRPRRRGPSLRVMSKRRTHAQAGGARSRKSFHGRRMREPRTPTDNVRAAAGWVVERTLSTLSPSSVFLQSALARLDEPEHALLRELSLGTLRWLRRLDHVITLASHRKMEAIDPALRTPLRIGAYQLLFLDRIPPHAAVHEAVEHARRLTHKGGASFTNAVLRRIARDRSLSAWPVDERDPVERLAVEQSHPSFLVRRWLDAFGEQATRELVEADNRPKALQLLAFRDRGGRELLAESLIDQGVDVEPTTLSPMGLIVRQGNPLRTADYRRGDFYIQDEGSQAVAMLPPPRAGERILDAAAAPGGKTFALQALEPDVDAVMADISPARIATLRGNLQRLGRRASVVVADASRSPFSATFDRVILDLPCSGTGTLRKHPELKWRISESEVGRLSHQALRILTGSAERVAPGGLLIAMTCSLELEENEHVVRDFLGRTPGFVPVPLDEVLDASVAQHVVGAGVWRLPTSGDHDGFTAHVLRRRS